MGWFLVPYRRSPSPKPIRELVISDVLVGHAGNPTRFIDVEALGDVAVVKVIGPEDSALAAAVPGVVALPDLLVLGRLGDSLTLQERRALVRTARDLGYTLADVTAALGADDGAGARWLDWLELVTSARRKPRLDANGEIVLDGPVQPRTRPIPGDVGGGAFPTISTATETFTGSDSTTPINANWTNNVDGMGVGNGMQITSNQGAPVSGYSGSWWDTSTFGPDCEARAKVVVLPPSGFYYFGWFFRMDDPSSSPAASDGYELCYEHQSGTTQLLRAFRADNGSFTGYGSTYDISAVAANNHWLGAEVIGSSHAIYWSTDGSSWTGYWSATEGTYTGSGYLGFELGDTTARIDDAYFGTVVTGPPPPAPKLIVARTGRAW